jgi:hypothetical protein
MDPKTDIWFGLKKYRVCDCNCVTCTRKKHQGSDLDCITCWATFYSVTLVGSFLYYKREYIQLLLTTNQPPPPVRSWCTTIYPFVLSSRFSPLTGQHRIPDDAPPSILRMAGQEDEEGIGGGRRRRGGWGIESIGHLFGERGGHMACTTFLTK